MPRLRHGEGGSSESWESIEAVPNVCDAYDAVARIEGLCNTCEHDKKCHRKERAK